MSLSTLTETRLIPFEDELRHIETYVSLEKLRFNDRINVIYDIKAKDFDVPPLSIQPIVENAIKHGILKRVEGGTLYIRTYSDDSFNTVIIQDDGIGFNIDDVNFTNNKHVGLNNIKSRIKNMCDGDIKITSELDKGTTVVVTFNK